MQAVFFDFDFTLADSSEGIFQCFKHAMSAYGLDIPSKDEVIPTIGMSVHQALSILAPGHSHDYHSIILLFKEHADRIIADSTTIYEQTPEIVGTLREMGYSTGIVSTKKRIHIESALTRERLNHLFDVIVGGEDVTRYKPDPEGIERAIFMLGCSKDTAIYVGDTTIDALAAAAAGVRFIGISTGFTPDYELKASGAEAVVGSLRELLDLLAPKELIR